LLTGQPSTLHLPNTACTDDVGSQGCKEKEYKSRSKGAKKQQHLPTTFTRLRKSVDKGCIMMLER
jgi:hypothetical protein